MRKVSVIIAFIALLSFAIVGIVVNSCQTNRGFMPLSSDQINAAMTGGKRHTDQYTGDMWSKSKLPPSQAKKIKAEIEAGFKQALGIWLQVKDNPNGFEKGMAGDALKELKRQYTDELTQGKIKIRVHDNREFEVVQIKEKAGAIAYTYTDNGYYIDAKTKQSISKPLGKKREWLIGISKIGNTWKITDIVTLKPKASH